MADQKLGISIEFTANGDAAIKSVNKSVAQLQTSLNDATKNMSKLSKSAEDSADRATKAFKAFGRGAVSAVKNSMDETVRHTERFEREGGRAVARFKRDGERAMELFANSSIRHIGRVQSVLEKTFGAQIMKNGTLTINSDGKLSVAMGNMARQLSSVNENLRTLNAKLGNVGTVAQNRSAASANNASSATPPVGGGAGGGGNGGFPSTPTGGTAGGNGGVSANSFVSQFSAYLAVNGALTAFSIGLRETTQVLRTMVSVASDVGRQFVEINEQFQGLKITLRSVFGSETTADKISNQITSISSKSFIPYSDLIELYRSASVLPTFRDKFSKQADSNTLGDKDGSFEKFRGLIERMIAFRPDKKPSDAIFSVREALGGNFVSLARRFDVSPTLLSSLTGNSVGDLKGDSEKALKALDEFFKSIIDNRALQQITRQPSVLFSNIKEQFASIALKDVGQTKGKDGKSFFEYSTSALATWLDGTLQPFFDSNTGDFAKNYAGRMGDALKDLFDGVVTQITGIADKLLESFGFGTDKFPGLDRMSRGAELFASLLEKAAIEIPNLLNSLREAIPALVNTFKFFYDAIQSLITVFTTLGPTISLALTGLGPALIFAVSSAIGKLSLAGLVGGAGIGIGAALGTFGTALITALAAFAAVTLAVWGLVRAAEKLKEWYNKLVGNNGVEGQKAIASTFNTNQSSTEYLTARNSAKIIDSSSSGRSRFIAIAKAVEASGIANRGSSQFISGDDITSVTSIVEDINKRLEEAYLKGNNRAYQRALKELKKLNASFKQELGSSYSVVADGKNVESFRTKVGDFFSSDKSGLSGTSSSFKVGRAISESSAGFTRLRETLSNDKGVLSPSDLQSALDAQDALVKKLRMIPSFASNLEASQEGVKRELDYIRSVIPSEASALGVRDTDEVKKMFELLSSEGLPQALAIFNSYKQFKSSISYISSQVDNSLDLLKGADNIFEQMVNVKKGSPTFTALRSRVIETVVKATGEPIKEVEAAVDSAISKLTVDKRGKNNNKPAALADMQTYLAKKSISYTDEMSDIVIKIAEGLASTLEAFIAKLRPYIDKLQGFLDSLKNQFPALYEKLGLPDTKIVDIPNKVKELAGNVSSSIKNSGQEVSTFFQTKADTNLAKGNQKSVLPFQDQSSQFLLSILGGDFESRISDKLKPSLESALTKSLDALQGLDAPEQLASKIVSDDFGTRLEGHLEALQAFQDAALKARDSTKLFSDEWMNANNVVNQTEGAIQKIRQQKNENNLLAQSAKQVGDAFTGSLSNGISDFILGTKSASEAFKAFIADFIQQAVRAMINQAVMKLFGSFGGAGGAGATGIFGAIAGAFLNKGGSVSTSTTSSGKLDVPYKYATGGFISDGSGTKDDVPAMLTQGEYVIRRGVVNRLGVDFFDRLNQSGSVKMYASGGSVGSPSSPSAPSAPVSTVMNSGNSTAISINVASSGESNTQKKGNGDNKGDDELARLLRSAVIEVLQDQQRIGGVLRK